MHPRQRFITTRTTWITDPKTGMKFQVPARGYWIGPGQRSCTNRHNVKPRNPNPHAEHNARVDEDRALRLFERMKRQSDLEKQQRMMKRLNMEALKRALARQPTHGGAELAAA